MGGLFSSETHKDIERKVDSDTQSINQRIVKQYNEYRLQQLTYRNTPAEVRNDHPPQTPILLSFPRQETAQTNYLPRTSTSYPEATVRQPNKIEADKPAAVNPTVQANKKKYIKIIQYSPVCIKDLHLSITGKRISDFDVDMDELDEWDPMFVEIKHRIEKVKRHPNCVLQFSWLELYHVYKVNNPYTKMLFELKKKEQLLTMKNTHELSLYHGTARRNIDSICKTNFNYRLCKRGRFGKGVSFSKQLSYSLSYCRQKDDLKCLVICKVLFAKSNVGDDNTICPDDGCDTTIRNNGAVTVKYDDDVFYPEYIVLFETHY